MTRAVPRGPEPRCHGISANVSMSGIRYWSDSAIRVKPSMDEPSNHVPCPTDSSSRWIGIVTALTWPMMSVNWSWTKRMPDAWAASILAVDSGLVATWTTPPAAERGGASVLEEQLPVLRQRPEVIGDDRLQLVGDRPERLLGGDHVLHEDACLGLHGTGLVGLVLRLLEGGDRVDEGSRPGR